MRKIISLLLFLGICLASLWNAAENYPPPKLTFGSYQVSVQDSGVVISSPHRPGTFLNILGYDEIVATEDEDQIRLGGFDAQSRPMIPFQKIRDLILPPELKVTLQSIGGKVGIEYRIERTGPQSIQIIRTIKSTSNLLSLQKGLIFNSDDVILLNGLPARKTPSTGSIEATGITEITIRNPHLPQELAVLTDPTSTIIVDFDFSIIKEKKQFSSPAQILELFQEIRAKDR